VGWVIFFQYKDEEDTSASSYIPWRQPGGRESQRLRGNAAEEERKKSFSHTIWQDRNLFRNTGQRGFSPWPPGRAACAGENEFYLLTGKVPNTPSLARRTTSCCTKLL
jgi:hypothetical protein